MSAKRQSIFEQIKSKIALRKEEKEIDIIMGFIQATVKSDEGMLIPYELEGGTGEPLSKQITEKHFEYAFHEKVWANMYPQEKVVVLMWLDHYFAKKDNRPEAVFELDFKFNTFNIDYEDDEIVFQINLKGIQDGSLSAYDCATEIIRLSVIAKSIIRLEEFYNDGKVTDLDENYLKSLQYLRFEPPAYYRLIGAKTVEQKPGCFSKEELEEYDKLFAPLTPEEEQEVIYYFLQPYVAEFEKECKVLDEFGERNDFYMGKDNTREACKILQENQEKIANDFLNNKLGNKDKREVFLDLCSKKENEKMSVEIIKEN